MTRALRALYKLPWNCRSRTVYESTNSRRLTHLIEISKCKLIYKIKNNLMKTNIRLMNNSEIHNFNLRNNNNIHISSSRTNRLKNSPIHSSAVVFNSLPPEIQQERSFFKFKTRLKAYFK